MEAGFAAVKRAFESAYACMGITCDDVGGLLSGSSYFEGAEPCVKQVPTKTVTASAEEGDAEVPTWAIVVIATISVLLLGAGVFGAVMYRQSREYQKLISSASKGVGGEVVGASA